MLLTLQSQERIAEPYGWLQERGPRPVTCVGGDSCGGPHGAVVPQEVMKRFLEKHGR